MGGAVDRRRRFSAAPKTRPQQAFQAPFTQRRLQMRRRFFGAQSRRIALPDRLAHHRLCDCGLRNCHLRNCHLCDCHLCNCHLCNCRLRDRRRATTALPNQALRASPLAAPAEHKAQALNTARCATSSADA